MKKKPTFYIRNIRETFFCWAQIRDAFSGSTRHFHENSLKKQNKILNARHCELYHRVYIVNLRVHASGHNSIEATDRPKMFERSIANSLVQRFANSWLASRHTFSQKIHLITLWHVKWIMWYTRSRTFNKIRKVALNRYQREHEQIDFSCELMKYGRNIEKKNCFLLLRLVFS